MDCSGAAFDAAIGRDETIDYFLVDPNIRLIHDQFIRLYPKLSYLKMSHIQANAEFLPIKENWKRP